MPPPSFSHATRLYVGYCFLSASTARSAVDRLATLILPPHSSSSPRKKPTTLRALMSGASFFDASAHRASQSGRMPMPFSKKTSCVAKSEDMPTRWPCSIVVKLAVKPAFALSAWSSVNDSLHWFFTSFVTQV